MRHTSEEQDDILREHDYEGRAMAEEILTLRDERDSLESEVSRLTDELEDAQANS